MNSRQLLPSEPRILIVEDNEMNRSVIALFFDRLEYSYDLAETGKEATEIVLLNHYDIIFMDCQMPVMDGFQATREIRKKKKLVGDPWIIAMTANGSDEDRRKCLAAGMDDFLPKPIVLDDIRRIMRKYWPMETTKKGEEKGMADAWYGMDFMEAGLKEFMEKNGFDERIGKKLYNDYVTQLPKTIGLIEMALVSEDFGELSKLTHQLKGTSGMLRIKKMADLSLIMELAAKKCDKVEITDILEKIKWLFDL